MNKLINVLKQKWLFQLLGVIALCLLIAFVGPLISVAGNDILESVFSRVMTCSVIIVFWLMLVLRTQIKANRNNVEMVDGLMQGDGEAINRTGDSAAYEIDDVTKKFDTALQTLKSHKNKSQQGKHFLYDLPWYVIIGPPGSGKTTALINSGLEFPLVDSLGKKAVHGVGGTRNCDWWFTDQAVMLDTAGRYTTQDSHTEVDKSAWLGFIDLLTKHRPRRPLNGILITMSCSDILSLSAEQRSLHAKTIRCRIEELSERTGIQIPIYMIFTKTDLIAGFTDFFADYGRDERSQVWGVTFDQVDDENKLSILTVEKDYEELLARLNRRVNSHMQDERDLTRRNLIFGFPQRMTLLKAPLISFLQECFSKNRFQTTPLLRGVYFTSGTQEGTPIDRLMGVLVKAFKLDRIPVPLLSGKGKSYFITTLLKDVIFAESELVGLNQKVEKRRNFLQQAVYVGAFFLVLVFAGLWTQSYLKNQSLLQVFNEKTAVYNAVAKENLTSHDDFLGLLKKMNALYALREVYPEQDASWSLRFGLYQGEKLRDLASTNYQKLLKNLFLPMIKKRLEQRMLFEVSQNDEVLYQLLRVYLMLGNSEKVDKVIVQPWVKVDWDNSFELAVVDQLSRHLDELLKLELPEQTMDWDLIKEIRKILSEIPLAQQIFKRIKADAQLKHDHDFILTNELGLLGDRLFSTKKGTLKDMIVPGLFTYQGFHQLFLKKSNDLAKQTLEQRWVLGEESLAGGKNLKQLEGKLFAYYYAEYIKIWNDLLANITIKQPVNINQAVEALEIISAFDSPLKRLLESVEKETSLPRGVAANDQSAVDKIQQGVSVLNVSSRMQRILNKAKGMGAGTVEVDKTGKTVEKFFSKLHQLVRQSSSGYAPIDATISGLNELYRTMSDLANSVNSGVAAVDMAKQSGGGDSLIKMQRQSERLPAPVNNLLNDLVSTSQGLVMGGARSQLRRTIKTEVTALCEMSIAGRYPIERNSQVGVTLQDFGHFFAKRGVLDGFFSSHLQPFVDTKRKRWRVVSSNKKTIGVSSLTLQQFQSAAKIRDVFFQQGGQLPSVKFELKPVFLDARVSRFWLNLEGQQTSYRHGPTRAKGFSWPGKNPGLVRFGFETLDGKQVSRSEEGDWAWFRLLDKMTIKKSIANSHIITFNLKGYIAKYVLRANSVLNPFVFSELKAFKCPGSV